MDELKAFREIKKVAQHHYFTTDESDKRNHFEKGVEYLTQCQGILYTYFKSKSELSGKIIYSTLSYIDHREKNKTHTALIANNNFKSGYYWNDGTPNFEKEQIAKADRFFKMFIDDINRNNLISLTNILFDRTKFKAPDFIISNCEIDQEDVYTLDSGVAYQEEPLCHFQYHKKKGDFYSQYKSSIDSFIDVYNQKKVSFLNSDYIGKVKNYFNRYQTAINLFGEMGFKNISFNFIKPFLEGNEYNVLLTVATNESLTNSERAVINLFLYKIVSYMATDIKIDKIERQNVTDLVQTTYSLGHNLKNRLLDTDRQMSDLIDDLETSSLKDDEKEEIKNYATNVSLKVKSLFNTGKILDLIGRFMTENKWQSKWLTKQDFLFREKLPNGELSKISISGKNPRIKMDEFSESLKVSGWLGPSANDRPADFVYNELFFELFINSLTYGKAYICDDRKYVDIIVTSQAGKIIIANTPAKSIKVNDKFKDWKKNTPISPEKIGHGGLLYIYKFLTQTNIGVMNIILDDKEDKFKISLELKGTSYDK